MDSDTTALSYWLNWRFFFCAIFLSASMVASTFFIWKFEGPKKAKTEMIEGSRETVGLLYKKETWKTSLKVVHPCWLLAYRVASFSVLLSLIVLNIALDGGGIFSFYTQWTFSLVTLYFGFASLFSIYGCCQGCKEDAITRVTSDAERGTYVAATFKDDLHRENAFKSLNSNEEFLVTNIANTWGYAFQIIYQICAGSVVLTDCVFWFVIYPFMTSDDYRLGFIDICFHSINAVLLLGDVFLNCLVPFLSNCVIHFMDGYIRHVPVDHSLLRFILVAVPISRLVVPICSYLVLSSGVATSTLLWCICSYNKVQTFLLVDTIPQCLSKYTVRARHDKIACYDVAI